MRKNEYSSSGSKSKLDTLLENSKGAAKAGKTLTPAQIRAQVRANIQKARGANRG